MQVKSLRIALSSARKFINIGAVTRLYNLVKNFHAADIANLMEQLILRERLVLFNTLYEKNKEKAVAVLSEIDPEDAAQMLPSLPIDQITDLFHQSASDDVAAIIPLPARRIEENSSRSDGGQSPLRISSSFSTTPKRRPAALCRPISTP